MTSKRSSAKKVSRVARTGGGRTGRASRPSLLYPVSIALVVALGVSLIVVSRATNRAAAAVHPAGSDHWHEAYGIDICGTMQPNLPQNPNLTTPVGIHTHGDGLIHVEPYFSANPLDAGKNATLARFAQNYPGFTLTSTALGYPGQTVHRNGDRCGGTPAMVRIRVWRQATGSASTVSRDPKLVHLENGEAITMAFLPDNADIPKPPPQAIANLPNFNAFEPTTTAAPTTTR